MPDACQRFHDHVASIYDDMYRRTPYWEFYHEASWDHMKAFLPRDLSQEAHDVGCGTGLYGLKLLKAGFRVCFSDISPKMLDVARRKVDDAGFADRAEFLRLDVACMEGIAFDRFGFICAQGDPISLCSRPENALREVARTLRSDGRAVISVDHRAGGYDFFFERGDLEGLKKFHRDGMLTWLAERHDERFPFFTFEPDDFRRLAKKAGLEVLSMIGKCVLPLRKHPELLEDRSARKTLLAIEKKLAGKEAYWGRASHLQIALRKV